MLMLKIALAHRCAIILAVLYAIMATAMQALQSTGFIDYGYNNG
jgi:hypothetical protein